MKQTTIRLDDRDLAAIADIREHFGLTTDIDAIRVALRELQRQIKKGDPPPKTDPSQK